MKVLHVYSGNLFGGVERMLLFVAALRPSRLEHHFALCFDGKLASGLRRESARLDLLPSVKLRNPLSVHRSRRALKRLLLAQHFDSVVCHGIWSYCVYAPTIDAGGHAPVLYLHDVPAPKNPYYLWASLRPPRMCIANSKHTARHVAIWDSRIKVAVVNPLVVPAPTPPADAVLALRSALGASAGEVVILQASRLDPWKGHRILLHALTQMRNIPDWRCWIAGSPQRPEEEAYRAELRRMVEQLGLTERVRFIGHRDDIAVALAACDIYCQPNETPEPYGMIFAEALAAGKPVVASDMGGVKEIVTPASGMLCQPDPASVSAALSPLVRDGGLREGMGQHALARAAELLDPETFERGLARALSPPLGEGSRYGIV
jgi:glycosyltransferase involved in cell wall biosynthesis